MSLPEMHIKNGSWQGCCNSIVDILTSVEGLAGFFAGWRKIPMVGVGIDEDTAVKVYPDMNFELLQIPLQC